MPPPRLIIHMDINETMILGDPAGGDTFEDSLNKIVCKQAVIRYGENGGIEWEDGSSIFVPAKVPPRLHFWDLPIGCARFYDDKQLKSKYAHCFCTDPESPGYGYAKLKSELEDKMRSKDETDARLVRGDYLYVIPGIWRLLDSLKDRRFTLVLRTFGHDLASVKNALDAYAEKRGLDDLKIKEEMMKMRRDGDRCFLEKNGQTLDERELIEEIERDDLGERRCIGISDDYASWKAADYHPSRGKPCWITSGETRHVFFDDNIMNSPKKSIVEVRALSRDGTVQRLSGEAIQKLHGLVIVRVPTMAAILDTEWFVKTLESVEKERDSQADDDNWFTRLL